MKLDLLSLTASLIVAASLNSNSNNNVAVVNALSLESSAGLRSSVLMALQKKKKRKRKAATSDDDETTDANASDGDDAAFDSSKLPPQCKGIVGSGKLQDRYCEKTDIIARIDACGCKEQCHIWGDPHVEPFFSSCDVKSLKRDGWWSFLHIEEGSDKISVVGYSKSFSQTKEWVISIYVNDEEVLNKEQCDTGHDTTVIREFTISPTGYPNDLRFRIEAYCESRGPEPHVNAKIEVIDDYNTGGSGIASAQKNSAKAEKKQQKKMRSTTAQVPISLAMLPKAAGACMNPCHSEASYLGPDDADRSKKPQRTLDLDAVGEKECSAGNGYFWQRKDAACIKRPGSINGRECSCSAQCAVHGDPYLVDFFRKMPTDDSRVCRTTSGKKNQCILVFPEPEDTGANTETRIRKMQSREFYMVPNQYQSEIATDECELITEYRAKYVVKNKVYTAVYNAEAMCKGKGSDSEDTAGSLGYIIKAPNVPGTYKDKKIIKVDKKVFDENTRSFKLATTDTDTEHVINIPGTLVANLKCHKTLDKKDRPSTYYFNVCMEREGAKQTLNGQPLEDINFASIELNTRSRGHCTTGKVIGEVQGPDPNDPLDFIFENRVIGEYVPYQEQYELGGKPLK